MKKKTPDQEQINYLVEGVLTYLKDKGELELLPQISERLDELVGQESEVAKVVQWLLSKIEEGPQRDLMPSVAKRLREVSRLQQEEAVVLSAVPLTKVELKEIGATLAQKLNRPCQIKNVVDPSIIGGLVLKLGDQVVDLSLASRLETLKRTLSQ